ncbi:thioredoxin family protein [Rhodocytophaga rosea]|uniref:Thioredoxin family protein n=2 Tax=Rhodocytophaga rosea TaxID=2704465 RepID=A0A6C0GW90_9BACT|nr:thioredoxin family protein [Rhodocytophaga rosea]
MENLTTVITHEHIEAAYSYEEYRTMLDELLASNQTTGPKQTPELVQITKLNIQRMHRLDKTAVLHASLVEKLKLVQDNWIWLVILEAWCGDAAQFIPYFVKMAHVNENISLKFMLRDENPEVMDRYLTNGTRSIPKLICLQSDTLAEIGTWGPRPATAQQMVMEHKKNPQMANREFTEMLHTWYTKDKAQQLQQEFEELLVKWNHKAYV